MESCFYCLHSDQCDKPLEDQGVPVEIIYTTSDETEISDGSVPVLPNQQNSVTLSFGTPNGDNAIGAQLYSINMGDPGIESVTIAIMGTLDDSEVPEPFEVKLGETGMFMIPEEFQNIPVAAALLSFNTPDIESVQIDLEGCIKVGKSHFEYLFLEII